MIDDNKKLFIKKTILMIISYVVFYTGYYSAAFYTSGLNTVNSIVFDFEERIPFIPWMIIPYMSSGIIFVLVFYIPRDWEKLWLLFKRINFITIASIIIFLMFPLKFSYTKPIVENQMLSIFFNLLGSIDNNYNQLPSLHVSYAIIFWIVFKENVQSKFRYLYGIWLLFMALGTLTVYQHHFIDIPAAFLLIVTTLYIFKGTEDIKRVNVKLVYYLISIVSFTIAMIINGYWLLLLYPSLCFYLVGQAYADNNPHFLKDDNGEISFIKRVLYLPYLLIIYFMWRCFRENTNYFNKTIIKNIYVGSRLGINQLFVDYKKLIIVDLSAELIELRKLKEYSQYYCYPILDICEIDKEYIIFIRNKIIKLYKEMDEDKIIYIHCTMGYSRSFLLIAMILMVIKKITYKDSIQKIYSNYKNIKLHNYYQKMLRQIQCEQIN